MVNDSNIAEQEKIINKLSACVGEKIETELILQKAKSDLVLFEYQSAKDLEYRLNELEKIPVVDCDNFVFSDAAVMLWNPTNNKN
ncbi:unnamed protein product [marine sediment metagenome]|uniref:Uncharacterized protein n=1 Tax=marine sediment metagenome TaxID=412755 RepID=X1QJK6_9ZZZZ